MAGGWWCAVTAVVNGRRWWCLTVVSEAVTGGERVTGNREREREIVGERDCGTGSGSLDSLLIS